LIQLGSDALPGLDHIIPPYLKDFILFGPIRFVKYLFSWPSISFCILSLATVGHMKMTGKRGALSANSGFFGKPILAKRNDRKSNV